MSTESEAVPEPSFMQRGATSFKETLRQAARYKELGKTPYGLKPIVVFAFIAVISSFDSRIFGLAIRDVLRELGPDVGTVFRVLTIVSFVVTFAILGVAYLSDRVKRVPIVGAGVVLSGIFSILTSRAGGIWSLGMTRAGDAVGDAALGVPIGSLQADYYPVEHRGKAFAFFGVTGRAVALATPLLAALILTKVGWRQTFMWSGLLMIAGGLLTFFLLREPIRGYMDRKALGLSEELASRAEDRPSFGESWRTIWSVRTLRRLFISDIPGGAVTFIYSFFFPLLLFQHYRLSIVEVGVIFSIVAVVGLPFGFLAGGVVDVLVRRRPQRVLVFSGLLTIIASLFIGIISLTPPIWVLVVVVAVFFAASSLVGPARGVLFAQIVPAHMRTLGLSVQVLATIPGNILRFYLVPLFAARWGIEGGLFSAVPLLFVAGLIELSAAGFFERDMKAALASQVASEEYRRAKEEGKGKLLVCREVDVEYDGVQVLFGVDFDVDQGQIIALLGTNGAGKSTLLKAISGTAEASAGAIVFDGRDITHMPPPEIAARGVTLMPGGRGIFPGLTVGENLMLGGWLADPPEADQRLKEVYETFPMLEGRSRDRAGLLSGGEQQMLSLAQAFLTRPRLLMIDELSLGLAPAVVGQLIDIVKRINEQGTTVILVEQSVNVALSVAERAIFMEKGEVRFVGETSELLNRPDILRAVYVKGTGNITGRPDATIRSAKDIRANRLSEAGSVLEVKDIAKSFGGIKALDSISFELREGEILGLIGPNGAGKTTLFDIISGYLRPDRGQVLHAGVNITNMSAEDRAAGGLVRRFQDARMVPSLTVFENLLLALEGKLDPLRMAGIALQLPEVRRGERRARLRAENLIELVRLEDYRDKFVRELSTGLRRLADLACVLARYPKLLMLDEPSTGIAQAEAQNLGPLLRRVRIETSCSMLVIEHDMSLISSVADELVAMDQGTVVTRGLPDAVLNDERVIEAYLGGSEDAIRRSAPATR